MVAATLPLPHTDSTASGPTVNFSRSHFAYRQLETWLTSDEAAGLSEAQIEDQIQERGREMLRLLLQAHIDERGTGDVGPALQVYSPPTPDTTPNNADATPPTTDAAPNNAGGQATSVRHGEKRYHNCTLRTVFGKIQVTRTA